MANQTVIWMLAITTCETLQSKSEPWCRSMHIQVPVEFLIVIGLFQRYFLLEKGILKYSKTQQDVSDQI